MPTHVDWYGDQASDHVRKRAAEFLEMAAIVIERQAKRLLNVEGSGRVRGKKVGPIVRSKPGEPPRKQTGLLHDSITHELDDRALIARVGTNRFYGKILETKLNRVFLQRAVDDMKGRVNEILARINTE